MLFGDGEAGNGEQSWRVADEVAATETLALHRVQAVLPALHLGLVGEAVFEHVKGAIGLQDREEFPGVPG